MSVNINRVTLAGNFTRDPEIKQIGNSKVVANFTIACNRRWRGEDGETKEEATFVDCEAWGRTAELIGQYIGKGQACLLEGRLRLEQWQDSDNKRQSRLRVVADQVHFLPQRSTAAERDRSPQALAGTRVHEGPSLEQSLAAAGSYQA